MYLPRLRTVRTASAKLRVPAATCAEYSPRLCPATKAGLETLFVQNTPSRDGRSQNRGLRDLGQAKLIFRTFEAKLRELVAEGFVGFFESLPCDGIFFRQFFAHADGLGSLAGKKKCDGSIGCVKQMS